MSSWYSSWLPSLPALNFALPSSLQGRFVSFLLKKCLGHFLKPGQLDVHQIESQIGSGFVQVNDLELNNEAINSFFTGLPLVLRDGYISSVTARVPWPNPLTSNLGLTLDTLQLTLHVVPDPSTSETADLVDSVASVAESFLHEELTEQENMALWESTHAETIDEPDNAIPGGLEPFLSHEEGANQSERDATGVSLFSTFVEKLLARFEFLAANTTITIVHEGNMNLTISIPEVHFGREAESSTTGGNWGSLTISGFTITTQSLRSLQESHAVSTPTTPCSPALSLPIPQVDLQPASPATSSSSLDEETQAMMSQSLVALPPRSSSPPDSISSSLYQSALSERSGQVDSAPSGRSLAEVTQINMNISEPSASKERSSAEDSSQEVLISFGSTPVTARITSPSPQESDKDGTLSTHSPFKISVTVGIIASAVHAWQLAGVVELLEFFALHSAPKSSERAAGWGSVALAAPTPTWMLDVACRGIVLLVLPANTAPRIPLHTFFAEPLKFPRLLGGYLRLHVINLALKVHSPGATMDVDKDADPNAVPTQTNLDFELRCADVYACIHSFSNPTADMLISPVLSVNHDLTSQYVVPTHRPGSDMMDMPLPTFGKNNWFPVDLQDVAPETPSSKAFPVSEDMHDNIQDVREQPAKVIERPAILVHVKGTSEDAQVSKNEISVSILPINILLDIEQLIGNTNVITFFRELAKDASSKETPTSEVVEDIASSNGQRSDTPPATAKVKTFSEREKERRRLERLVMEDLGLSVNLPVHDPEPKHIKTTKAKRRSKTQTQTTISVLFSLVRVGLRCSPVPGQMPRSGVLFADLHQLKFNSGGCSDDRHPKFTTPALDTTPNYDPQLRLECNAIVFSLSLPSEARATAIVSIASLHDSYDSELTEGTALNSTTLKPGILVSNTVLTTVLDLKVPSLNLHLTKKAFDGLLFLADDMTQLLELVASDVNTNGNGSSGKGNQLQFYISVTEASVRFMTPRPEGNQVEDRPFVILASDLIISIEAGSQSMTIANLEAMELTVKNMSPSRQFQTILARTAPRSMSSLPRAALKIAFTSSLVLGGAKVTKLISTLWGFTGTVSPDLEWLQDLKAFFQSPPGVFESVIPNEKTSISLRIQESSVCVVPPIYPGALVLCLGDLEFSTEFAGTATENAFLLRIPNLSVLTTDDTSACEDSHDKSGVSYWRSRGYALIAESTELMLNFSKTLSETPSTIVVIDRGNLRIHLCADTSKALSSIISDWKQYLYPKGEEETTIPRKEPAMVLQHNSIPTGLTSSVDEFAFRRLPEIGPAPDMINDDLPTNLDYLDESFSAAAGLREFSDEDLDDFKNDSDFDVDTTTDHSAVGVTSRVGGETVKMLRSEGIQVIEGYFQSPPSDDMPSKSPSVGDTYLHVRVHDCNLTLCLYDGYDWVNTRKTIEEEVKDMRRRLAKLKQLVASGQTPDASMQETSTVLFNSVYIGLEQDVEGFEPGALMAAIDEQLNDDVETASQSSWQSLRPHTSGRQKQKSIRVHGKRLTRSKGPSMEFVFTGVKAEIDHYHPSGALLSKTFFTVTDVEILDHIKTSTWRKFLTGLQLDSRGNTRETDSNMIRVESHNIRPVPGHPSEEVRLRAKILPLRLYVDQDAVDFLKKFFSFKDPNVVQDAEASSDGDAFIQFAEIFPVFLKLDYKPRRVDYKALRDGRTIELMNFFHFDGAEMTLRHITLVGVTGWPRLFELLNDLWTPDVKATQLVDVISGVAPIRSVVNVGSGVADLVLLPIAQYKKDGRVLRGLQRGTTAFFKSTALEAIKLGAKLATGTQVILEQAEGVLGGQFQQPVTTETIPEDDMDDAKEDEGASDAISKYAEQPMDIKEGVQSAYKSLRKNFNSAAQTILAVPMEVYERSGDEGAIRSVIRAVPIAVLKPMIGATEAVSKTLLGLHNTLDSNVRHDNEAKYKHR